MKIEIKQPHPGYPYAFVHVGVSVNTDRPDLADILAKNNLTLLGPWKPEVGKDGTTFAAPVLLEDQYTKPRKRTASKPAAKKITARSIRK
jgi:hypothetical protein